MSSSKKTTNLKLHSWVKTDPVLCADFNENFTKIDTAIGTINSKYGCCEIYSGSYAGAGGKSWTLTFPKAPLFVLIRPKILNAMKYYSDYIWDQMYFDCPSGFAIVTVSGNKIIFNLAADDYRGLNVSGTTYYYFALAAK